jgi:putative salt-induced outer membrane protein YdiY
MKTNTLQTWLLGLALAAGPVGAGAALAQTAETEPADGAIAEAPAVPETPVEIEPPATNAVPPVAPEPEEPAEPEPPAKPSKPAPVYRGADMKEAFKGADSSRFGVSGRVNKMPAKKSARKEKGSWKRVLEAGVSTASGNKNLLRYDGAASAAKETEANYVYLEAAGRYGESDNETDAANATGEAKYQHKLTERTYAALDGYAKHDQIADLAYRLRGSLSLGRRFVWTERAVLSAELGPGYVSEKKGGDKEGFFAGRVGQYLEILISDNLQLWQSAEFVQNLEDNAVYFVNAEIGLETVLMGNLNLRFSVEDAYDSQPAEGKEGNDLTTKTALVWKF